MREADYASATFLYHQPRLRLLQTDELARVVPAATEQQPLRLRIAQANAGVKLRRTFDRASGVQRARVEVDGVTVGSWYGADRPRAGATGESDFFVPAQLTAGKTSIDVTLVADGPFDVARLRVLSVLR